MLEQMRMNEYFEKLSRGNYSFFKSNYEKYFDVYCKKLIKKPNELNELKLKKLNSMKEFAKLNNYSEIELFIGEEINRLVG